MFTFEKYFNTHTKIKKKNFSDKNKNMGFILTNIKRILSYHNIFFHITVRTIISLKFHSNFKHQLFMGAIVATLREDFINQSCRK